MLNPLTVWIMINCGKLLESLSFPTSFPSLPPHFLPSLSLLYLLYNKYASLFWLHIRVRCFAVFHTRAKNRPRHLRFWWVRGCILLPCLNNSLEQRSPTFLAAGTGFRMVQAVIWASNEEQQMKSPLLATHLLLRGPVFLTHCTRLCQRSWVWISSICLTKKKAPGWWKEGEWNACRET